MPTEPSRALSFPDGTQRIRSDTVNLDLLSDYDLEDWLWDRLVQYSGQGDSERPL
jgi:hypothetical protein